MNLFDFFSVHWFPSVSLALACQSKYTYFDRTHCHIFKSLGINESTAEQKKRKEEKKNDNEMERYSRRSNNLVMRINIHIDIAHDVAVAVCLELSKSFPKQIKGEVCGLMCKYLLTVYFIYFFNLFGCFVRAWDVLFYFGRIFADGKLILLSGYIIFNKLFIHSFSLETFHVLIWSVRRYDVLTTINWNDIYPNEEKGTCMCACVCVCVWFVLPYYCGSENFRRHVKREEN